MLSGWHPLYGGGPPTGGGGGASMPLYIGGLLAGGGGPGPQGIGPGGGGGGGDGCRNADARASGRAGSEVGTAAVGSGDRTGLGSLMGMGAIGSGGAQLGGIAVGGGGGGCSGKLSEDGGGGAVYSLLLLLLQSRRFHSFGASRAGQLASGSRVTPRCQSSMRLCPRESQWLRTVQSPASCLWQRLQIIQPSSSPGQYSSLLSKMPCDSIQFSPYSWITSTSGSQSSTVEMTPASSPVAARMLCLCVGSIQRLVQSDLPARGLIHNHLGCATS